MKSPTPTPTPPALTLVAFNPSYIGLSVNSTNATDITLDCAQNGLSGYNVTISLSKGSVAEITSVDFPSWASINSNSPLDENLKKVVF